MTQGSNSGLMVLRVILYSEPSVLPANMQSGNVQNIMCHFPPLSHLPNAYTSPVPFTKERVKVGSEGFSEYWYVVPFFLLKDVLSTNINMASNVLMLICPKKRNPKME